MKNLYLIILTSGIFFSPDAFSQPNYGVRGGAIKTTVRSIAQIKTAEVNLADTREFEKEEIQGILRAENLPGSQGVPYYPYDGGRAGTMVSANLPVHNNFLAIQSVEANMYPADANGDVSSARQVMCITNGRMKVFNLPPVTGTALTTVKTSSTTTLTGAVLNVNLHSFFGNAALGITQVTDVHVRFDRLSDRWFLIAQDKSHSSRNYLIVAVSNSTLITSSSTFSFYYIESTTGSLTPDDDYFDYPTLGIDNAALYVGTNVFNKAYTVDKGSSLFVINKASLLSGNVSFRVWQYGIGSNKSGSDGVAGILAPQGVQNDDSTSNTGYFIGVNWAAYGSLVIKKISNPGGDATLSDDIVLTVPTTIVPIYQAALGSAGKLGVIDDRLFNATIMKNKINGLSSLWTAQCIEINAYGVATSGGGRNGSRWYEITNLNSTPTLRQAGTVFDNATTNPKGFIYPSIAMNGQGHAILGATTSSANRRTQVAYTTRYADDVLGKMQTYDTVTQATSPYVYDAAPYRWGDFSQTVVDPTDNMTIWTFQQYAAGTNQWGMRAVEFKAPPPAQSLSLTCPNFCDTAAVLTITGLATNHAGFFDAGPGYNRFKITCSGGIPVSGIELISPTQLRCKVNTRGKLKATYTLTITNPDGQFITKAFSLAANCPALTSAVTNQFEIFPNPASRELRLTMMNSNKYHVTITDDKKVTFLSQDYTTDKIIIPIAKLIPGVYHISVNDGTVETSKVFIKE